MASTPKQSAPYVSSMSGKQHSFEGPILSVSPTTYELLESRNCVLFVLDDLESSSVLVYNDQFKNI